MTIRGAVVAGGGIAGPVVAMALQRVGVEVSVHEARGAGSDGVGAFLTLAENGLRALEPIGLRAHVEDLGMATPAMRLVNARGVVLGAAPMHARTLLRSDLYARLRDEAVRRGIEVRYDHEVTGAQERPDGVRVGFGDGTSLDADLLVGADGIGSRVRRLVDPSAPAPHPLGLLNTGGIAHGLDVSAPDGVAHFVFGRRCFVGWFRHPDGSVWWFANPQADARTGRHGLRDHDATAWRAHLRDLLAGGPAPTSDLVDATAEIVAPWLTSDLPKVPRWHTDRIVLVGDALHAASPASGQGASMAVEDAVVLARCVRDRPDAAAAAVAFTALRRDRVEWIVKQGRRNGSGKTGGPVSSAIRDRVLPWVLKSSAVAKAQQRMVDYDVEWDRAVPA